MEAFLMLFYENKNNKTNLMTLIKPSSSFEFVLKY